MDAELKVVVALDRDHRLEGRQRLNRSVETDRSRVDTVFDGCLTGIGLVGRDVDHSFRRRGSNPTATYYRFAGLALASQF
jgi:hypothetical protein